MRWVYAFPVELSSTSSIGASWRTDYQVFYNPDVLRTQQRMKHDSSRQVGTGVTLNGLNGNGGHEVQGVAISLGAAHGRPARMREG